MAEPSPTFGEQVPPAGIESEAPAPHSPSEGKQALLDMDQQIPSVVMRQAELEIQGSSQQPEEEHDLDQSMAAEMEAALPGEREESPVPAPQSPCSPRSPSAPQVDAQATSEQQQEEPEGWSVPAVQETEEGVLDVVEKDWKDYIHQEISQREHEEDQELSQEEFNRQQGVSQGEACIGQELSPRQVKGYQELPDWEEDTKQGQRQEGESSKEPSSFAEYIKGQHSTWEDSRFQTLPDWEDSSMEEWFQGKESISPELSDEEDFSQEWEFQGTDRICQDLLSDWEDSISQELSQDYSSTGHEVSDWEEYVVSVLSRWEDDSARGFTVEQWEYTSVQEIEVQHLRAEEDEWEEVSVLELWQGEGREERLGSCVAEGFSVPAPREAWAERRAPAPRTQVPGCVCPAQLAAQCPRGAAASPALEEQVAEAGTRSQVPAPRSPCCTPSPSHAHMALPIRRPSRVRRALGALHRLLLSCLGAQPED